MQVKRGFASSEPLFSDQIAKQCFEDRPHLELSRMNSVDRIVVRMMIVKVSMIVHEETKSRDPVFHHGRYVDPSVSRLEHSCSQLFEQWLPPAYFFQEGRISFHGKSSRSKPPAI